MISKEAFISSLQDKTVIEINDTAKFIEDTIKKDFDSIQTQLVDKIKTDVRDELIKKIGNSEKDTNENKTVSKNICLSLKDEYIIANQSYNRYHNDRSNTYEITYTNYNNVYDSRNPHIKLNKTIKLTKPIIQIINTIFTNLGEKCNFCIAFDGLVNYSSGDSILSFLTKTLPNLMYEIQEKYFGDNNYGIYGCKFEEIIEDYYKLQREMQIKNTTLENAKRELERLYSEVDRLKTELGECEQLKSMLMTLKNKI